jgi:hypothetical protein
MMTVVVAVAVVAVVAVGVIVFADYQMGIVVVAVGVIVFADYQMGIVVVAVGVIVFADYQMGIENFVNFQEIGEIQFYIYQYYVIDNERLSRVRMLNPLNLQKANLKV